MLWLVAVIGVFVSMVMWLRVVQVRVVKKAMK